MRLFIDDAVFFNSRILSFFFPCSQFLFFSALVFQLLFFLDGRINLFFSSSKNNFADVILEENSISDEIDSAVGQEAELRL